MHTVYDNLQGFFQAGGPVLWLIFFVTMAMWTLIIERYWFIYRTYPTNVKKTLGVWQQRADQQSWHAEKIREALLSQVSLDLNQSLHILRMLVIICPLLGLLGTVTGMIHVFDVITVLGTGNPRAISTGIYLATIPTMAGLVAALSGYYFSIRLKHKAGIEAQKTADLLVISTAH
ncbi:MAG: MotA/TolQ/ExbB proton channel family protein [Gammaproteobacteria bacterium]|nr:MotA/TolQ/ExbB proton channel family protein [Gammaproteobacteria bacterium]